jgi:hypothetical protein
MCSGSFRIPAFHPPVGHSAASRRPTRTVSGNRRRLPWRGGRATHPLDVYAGPEKVNHHPAIRSVFLVARLDAEAPERTAIRLLEGKGLQF